MPDGVIDATKLFIDTDLSEQIDKIPDSVLQRMAFAINPFAGETIDTGKEAVDEDGFPLLASSTDFSSFVKLWMGNVRNHVSLFLSRPLRRRLERSARRQAAPCITMQKSIRTESRSRRRAMEE
jgi:hypothetical protein